MKLQIYFLIKSLALQLHMSRYQASLPAVTLSKIINKELEWMYLFKKITQATLTDANKYSCTSSPLTRGSMWWICAGRVVDATRPPSDSSVVFNKKCQVGAATPIDVFSLATGQIHASSPHLPLVYPSRKVIRHSKCN